MARRSVPGVTYPDNWRDIAHAVKEEAGWCCVRCGHPHDPSAGRTLTIHHADMNPGNSVWWNLLPLCQACHLSVQGRVDLDRPWVMQEHSDWFKLYVAGFYAWKYCGETLTREEAEARLDELLQLECAAVLGCPGQDVASSGGVTER